MSRVDGKRRRNARMMFGNGLCKALTDTGIGDASMEDGIRRARESRAVENFMVELIGGIDEREDLCVLLCCC